MSAIAEADRAKFERILNNKKKTDLAGLLKAQREGTLDEYLRAEMEREGIRAAPDAPITHSPRASASSRTVRASSRGTPLPHARPHSATAKPSLRHADRAQPTVDVAAPAHAIPSPPSPPVTSPPRAPVKAKAPKTQPQPCQATPKTSDRITTTKPAEGTATIGYRVLVVGTMLLIAFVVVRRITR